MNDHTKIIMEEIEHSERTRDVPPPDGVAPLQRSADATTVYSLRLRHDTIAELTALAERYEIPTSTLVRGFILEGLSAATRDDVHAALTTLEQDVARLRRLIASDRQG